ncbi:MAG: hypothetical protein ABIG34_05545 [Candidatus Peregrinibacteria bacterium]
MPLWDSDGNFTRAANIFLSEEEIAAYNSTENRGGAQSKLERQAQASRLVSAAIQRKSLLEIEKRGKQTTSQANVIALLAVFVICLQTLFEVIKWKGW